MQQKGFLHSNHDCHRALMQQFKIGLALERSNDNNYADTCLTLAWEIVFVREKRRIAANVFQLYAVVVFIVMSEPLC
jgi:hypothetical protein